LVTEAQDAAIPEASHGLVAYGRTERLRGIIDNVNVSALRQLCDRPYLCRVAEQMRHDHDTSFFG